MFSMYRNLLSVREKIEHIESVLSCLEKCFKSDSAHFESDEFYNLKTFDYQEILKNILCVQDVVNFCIQECFQDSEESSDKFVCSVKQESDQNIGSKEYNFSDVKNKNIFEQYEEEKVVSNNADQRFQKRKRTKNEIPSKKSSSSQKSKKSKGKNEDKNPLKIIEPKSSFEQRRNLQKLISKICSLPDANSIPSAFEILQNKPPLFYGLSG